ncbi:MAG: type II toxin-antitoxin system HicA family toxin [Bacteroidales bacterium]|nr:type II toxin-antitoxin system HicA family toxin [Bacteroidales bacterium]
MKYKELERLLKKHGCYSLDEQQSGHPKWYSPTTGKIFTLSNHRSQEVASGTLRSILRDAGIKS